MAKDFFIRLSLMFLIPPSAFAFDIKSESKKTEWYDQLFFSEGKSLVVVSNFFISPEGMNNPEKEMEAEVQLLQSGDEARIAKFACRFPRRYSYLAPKIYPNPKNYYCDEHISWRDSFEASGISIMFASQYLENPASSFGHTYLKINSEKKALYLNKVISFFAEVPEKVGTPEYVWKGITGGFPGRFNSYPFYILYQEYANMEKRDIWEYELSLDQQATERILDSLYEIIHNAEFDYMFLTDNCSALLLRLLDQEIKKDLINEIPFYVIPIQTVKVLEKHNLIMKATYHPSITSRMDLLTQDMNQQELDEALSFIKKNKKLNPTSTQKTLDLGLEYLNFQRQKQGGEFNQEQKEDFSRYLILRAQKTSEPVELKQPLDPVNTPKSQRVSIRGQAINHDPVGFNLMYRPVGKDFFDRPNGFVKESEINVFKTQLYFAQKREESWGSIDVLGIKKYGDFNPITKSASWGVNLAYKSLVKEGDPSSYHAELDSYYGIGHSIFKDVALAYLVFHPTIRVGNVKHTTNFLPQAELGLIQSYEWFVWKISAFSGLNYDEYESRSFQNVKTSFSLILSKDYSLNLSQEYFLQGESWNTVELGASMYF